MVFWPFRQLNFESHPFLVPVSDGGTVSREEASLYLTFENGAPGIGKPWGEDPDLYRLSPLTLIYSNLAALP